MCLVVGGEMDRARPLFEQSLGLFRRSATPMESRSGSTVWPRRDQPAVLPQHDRTPTSLDILRAVGDRRAYGKMLLGAADINADLGDVETAAAQFEESLTLFVEFGDRWFGGIVLESAAFLAAATGDAARSVRLLAAADAIRRALEVPLWVGFRERHDRVLAETRNALGKARFTAAWEEGARTPISATVELVAPARTDASADACEGLTTREVEVLALVGQGLTDAEVAERLVVSIRTVHAHLRSIYRKLDVHSRTAATRYALEHRLVA